MSDVDLEDEQDGGAPDTAVRYQKARLKMLSKQLEDSVEMRKQLTETVNDLQKQIRVEREENKKQRKRIQLLESDAKRNSGKWEGWIRWNLCLQKLQIYEKMYKRLNELPNNQRFIILT